jgi:hypothetical protein
MSEGGWLEQEEKMGTRILACIALAVPLATFAQTPVYRSGVPADRTFADSLRVCSERNESLWDRKALIDQDRRLLEHEDQSIARVRGELEEALRTLDNGNQAAVTAYNARSYELNKWVDAHNRRVAELNGAVALLNSNAREMLAYCDRIYPAR